MKSNLLIQSLAEDPDNQVTETEKVSWRPFNEIKEVSLTKVLLLCHNRQQTGYAAANEATRLTPVSKLDFFFQKSQRNRKLSFDSIFFNWINFRKKLSNLKDSWNSKSPSLIFIFVSP